MPKAHCTNRQYCCAPLPPDLKKKLFPDDQPADPAKVRQSASAASKKEGYGEP